MMLAATLTLIHYMSSGHTENGLSPASFVVVGYTPFMMFRSIVGRSEATFESNRLLLYHRWVTLLDMMIARAAMEFAAIMFTTTLLLCIVTVAGIGTMPDKPLVFICAMLLLLWFSFSMGLVIASAASESSAFGRMVHPLLYLSLPASGAFYAMVWLPDHARTVLGWIPLANIFELLRYSEFANYPDTYADVSYVVAWCMVMTLLGLLGLTLIRRRMEIH